MVSRAVWRDAGLVDEVEADPRAGEGERIERPSCGSMLGDIARFLRSSPLREGVGAAAREDERDVNCVLVDLDI